MSYGIQIIIDGEAMLRTKLTHPYSYDPFLIYRGPEVANGTVYSDRLLRWDYDKHNRLCEKHFGNRGQYWDDRDPAKVEAFLQDYMDAPGLKLCSITEYCNPSNGYPYWRLDYRKPE